VAANLNRNLQSPANWRLPEFDRNLVGEDWNDDMIAVCRLKWSFRIKPDIVIQTSNNHALCVELTLESREGNYPSDGREIGQLRDRFKETYSSIFPVKQRCLQKFLMTKLLGIERRFLLIRRGGNSSTALPKVTDYGSADASRDLEMSWGELAKELNCIALPEYIDAALSEASKDERFDG
jgi:hypothetical protein